MLGFQRDEIPLVGLGESQPFPKAQRKNLSKTAKRILRLD